MFREKAPFGAWNSAIGERQVADGSVRLASPVVGRDANGKAFVAWIESRPDEGGRGAISALSTPSKVVDLIDKDYSARSRVHEYGGGALFAGGDGTLFFVNAGDQEIYAIRDDGPEQMTDAPDIRFADGSYDSASAIIYAIAERHQSDHDPSPENFIVGIRDGEADTICEGADFYSAPRISADGRRLAWLQWDLPHMPWEAAALFVAEIDASGQLGPALRIAGGIDGAAFQPEWGAGGKLFYVMEQGNWSHLFAYDPGSKQTSQISNMDGELLRPIWGLGTRSFTILGDGKIAAVLISNGEHELVLIDPANRDHKIVPQPHRQLHDPVTGPDGKTIIAIAHDDNQTPAIVEIGMDGISALVRRPGEIEFDGHEISKGETRAFLTDDGRKIYGVYYPPANSRYEGPDGVTPPLIVSAHGGPTGMADRGLKLKIQYWTSRGFAFVDVDYRGSTGYGRDYRVALDGQWGLLDAEDVLAVARSLIADKVCDADALFISGGSAGGFTVLMALVTGAIFRAGCVSYGVADIALLLATTHKFEAGYLYGLTGTSVGNTEPEFTDRSPIHQAGRISSPVLFLQGLEDMVVPPEQSRMMADTLRQNGVAAKLVEFPGEVHGFRSADTICLALAEEYAFYAACLGFEKREDTS